jgi:hypothetical protein
MAIAVSLTGNCTIPCLQITSAALLNFSSILIWVINISPLISGQHTKPDALIPENDTSPLWRATLWQAGRADVGDSEAAFLRTGSNDLLI